MPSCQTCGAFISRHDADYAAQLVGQGRETLCPSCAVALHYAALDQQNADDPDRHLKEDSPC
ncbi:MAG: hypothetical protein ACYC3I_02885 [Gemmataceae bacterium]